MVLVVAAAAAAAAKPQPLPSVVVNGSLGSVPLLMTTPQQQQLKAPPPTTPPPTAAAAAAALSSVLEGIMVDLINGWGICVYSRGHLRMPLKPIFKQLVNVRRRGRACGKQERWKAGLLLLRSCNYGGYPWRSTCLEGGREGKRGGGRSSRRWCGRRWRRGGGRL